MTISSRGQLVGTCNARLSVSEIARQMGISRSTMRCWLQQFEESANLADLPSSGRPKLTNTADDVRIVADIRNHPFTNAMATTEWLHLEVSARTVR
ncbi:putative winged helix-turn-helix domain containing protein 2 [Homarus americanus]|uniref:Putative winged helix-turn-helix domain containing protein 2 n=1 Tax=Homarus americanus TaxID=6706 RepID=A0A8J5TKW0_HOMAM|nr:putative winged helix-turn-helix domain containing protein 2 [Homarus americanus]